MQVLFRSFELDTGNEIIGHYVQEDGFRMNNGKPILDEPCIRHYMFDGYGTRHEIAPEYLSINFENMIDKNGKKIFASISEDGIGGDIIDTTIGTRQDFISICTKNGICVLTSDTSAIKNTPINTILNHNHRGLKVIGIYKGE